MGIKNSFPLERESFDSFRKFDIFVFKTCFILQNLFDLSTTKNQKVTNNII